MFKRFYQQISSVFPARVAHEVSQIMIQGGFEELSPRVYIGFAMFFSFCVFLLFFFLTPFLTDSQFLHLFVPFFAFCASGVAFYLFLLMTADSRARKIEQILPDALQIISANIRAGMTIENAIWSAARPEFGPLQDEIKRVSADTFGGTPIQDTLLRMSRRVRSVILERAVKLIVEGISLGGEMSRLLDEVAEDIRAQYTLHKEIGTSTLMYTIFIVFAAVFAAPLLFSVSSYYAEMNENVLNKRISDTSSGGLTSAATQRAGVSGLPGMSAAGAQASGISARDVYWFSVSCIVVTTFFAALILGVIRFGKATMGLKYAPLFVLGALAMFFAAFSVLKAALGGMMG
ncbi:Type II secretion system (T2SS), protein F [Candidatus Norongarragalina meridionalis]|nr:Type II secretion system (T2SS), protein F [Candidatus Norongarragalina meridionalis]